MEKKIFSACLAVLIGSPLAFLSCQKKPNPTNEKSIVIWHWMTDREEPLAELARRYQEQTGVEVKFQLYAPLFNYTQKVNLGAQTNTLPDIFGIMGDVRDIVRFIKAEHLQNLTTVLGSGKGSWKDRFYDEALSNSFFKEGNRFGVPMGFYGIPLDVSTIPMIYNKKLFKEAGLDPEKPPATWPEFIEAGKKLRQKGFTGFVSGWGEGWLIFSLTTDLAHNLMGADKVMDTFRGKVPYTDPQWVQVFGAFEDMQKAGFADSSLVTLENKNAEKKFASGRVGFTLNGSWSVNVLTEMNPALDYAPFRPPALNPKNPRPVWGGAGTVFYVNAKSPNKELAIDFLKYLTSKEPMEYLIKETRNLPSLKDVGGTSFPVLASFAALMKGSIHPNRFAESEDPKVTEVIYKGIQSILIGEKSAAQIAEEVQKTKEKVLKEPR